jgi:hypothetical protein
MSECICSGVWQDNWDYHSDYCPVYMRGRIAELEEAVKLLLSFAPKDCPEGLDPTFYHTLTYAGDRELQDRIDTIRALQDSTHQPPMGR